MKKIVTLAGLFFLLFSKGQILAQNVGIGTTAPMQKLHIAGGLRVDTLANGTDSGLLRHNALGTVYTLKFTGDSTQLLRGNGTFGASGLGTVWSLGGNAGTNAANNFIGTLDNNSLQFRVNNQLAGELDSINHLTFFGYGAGRNNTTGVGNTATGYFSLSSNTTGISNTANGYSSLLLNTTGNNNTGLGFSALSDNTTGNGNAALGSGGLASNFSGNNNTAIGFLALLDNTTGYSNVAIGVRALFSNMDNNNSVAVGDSALYNIVSGAPGNTALGSKALFSTTAGVGNTATGFKSLTSNTTGNDNVAMGRNVLVNNTTGSQNVAIGSLALGTSNAVYPNTAVGYASGAAVTTGYANTAMGSYSLYTSSTGLNNTAIGNYSLFTVATGSNNTAIGNGADVSAGTLNNATAIGSGAVVNASNKVRIGNSGVTVIEGQVPFTTPSDGRFKFNIREDVKGLDFILRLRPVTYQFDVMRFDHRLSAAGSPGNSYAVQASYDEATALRRTGFIAQEVEKAADESGYDFTGIVKPQSEDGHYSLSYESFVMPLVKAVQEQQKIIEAQNQRMDRQQQQINELIKLVGSLNEKIAK